MKLYHCEGSRSLRALWCLEELGLDYELESLPFPPRIFQPEYLKINELGTVPALIDDTLKLTESVAICQYLVDVYEPKKTDDGFSQIMTVTSSDPQYGEYLNWLQRADATFTFPIALMLRYSKIEPEERQQPQVVEDYKRFFLGRVRCIEMALKDGREFLLGDRFTVADIAVHYALFFGGLFNLEKEYRPETQRYFSNLNARPAFLRAQAATKE
jgi:glutathione S-transferase